LTLTGKERAALRAAVNRLPATVHVGQQGLTSALRESLEDALRSHELVKIQLGKLTDLPVQDAARQLALACGAEVIQVIGRTTTLYRKKPQPEPEPDSEEQ
jgi:RNA-binding protein